MRHGTWTETSSSGGGGGVALVVVGVLLLGGSWVWVKVEEFRAVRAAAAAREAEALAAAAAAGGSAGAPTWAVVAITALVLFCVWAGGWLVVRYVNRTADEYQMARGASGLTMRHAAEGVASIEGAVVEIETRPAGVLPPGIVDREPARVREVRR